MAISVYNVDFYRWYFKNNIDDCESLRPDQTVINNYKNPDSGKFDLTINLDEAQCSDSLGHSYEIPEFLSKYKGQEKEHIKHELEIDFTRYQEQQKAANKRLKYVRDTEKLCWKKRKGDDSFDIVTDFDIVLNSIIERYNLKEQEWERYYEATLVFERLGKRINKDIKLDPGDVHGADEFSKAVWEKDVLRVNNLRKHEMRDFWFHVNAHFEPRIVREYNHYGFITFEDQKYYLADNVLVKFPADKDHRLELIAIQNGAFPLDENKFVMPPDDALHLPHFQMGVPQGGQFKAKMNQLMDSALFKKNLKEVEHHFCRMVGADTSYNNWGKLLLGYIFSYLFFDDIYDHFKHIIFLYFYGEGNVGKGEAAKIIQNFYGINHLDSLNTPTARTVDNALESKSQIPQWIDEHVPEVPGKDAQIKDQTWNSWFELKPRPTSMRKGNTWATERKEVRTMPLFCSNFRPKTDHLLSRCLILEYTKKKRGEEKHLQWLKGETELLQLLMLSFMQHYNTIDRDAFIWDVERLRSDLKADIKEELKQRNDNPILQDRQIAQFAVLLTVYHWLDEEYRVQISLCAEKAKLMMADENRTNKKLLKDRLGMDLRGMVDQELYQFVKDEIIESAIVAAQNDPLTDYIETLGTLIQAGSITPNHYNWTDNGHLKIWAKAVWDEYLAAKRGTDDIVRREFVEDKLKQISELDDSGGLKTVVWQPRNAMKATRQKGFYIKDAWQYDVIRNAFQFDNWFDGNDEMIEKPTADKPFPLDDEAPF